MPGYSNLIKEFMSRTKLSSLAHIKDLADEISRLIAGAQSEYDGLARDSAKLKEIQPALDKMLSAIAPPPTAQPPAPGETVPQELPHNPVNRARHARKKKDSTNAEGEPDHQPE